MERGATIEARLRAALAPESIEVVDEGQQHAGHTGAGGGGHYALTIVSPRFQGKSPVERHQMVYRALGDLLPSEVHALSIRAFTPDEL